MGSLSTHYTLSFIYTYTGLCMYMYYWVIFLFLQRFLQQTGGRQGGWDDYDHQTFLKIRKQFNVSQ